ncbi:hypothetical protein ACVWXL_005875 [Bradyrhizobium sp. GM22.5]
MDLAGHTVEGILNIAPQAAKLVVGENTEHPVRVELPIVANADGAEPAISALILMEAERAPVAATREYVSASQIPPPKDVEAGPVGNWRKRLSLT